MVKYQKIDIYDTTVVFLVEPTKVEFEFMYHDNVTKITDDEYKQMYKDVFENEKCGGFTVPLENGDFVLCIKDALNHNYVSHEIAHTALRILINRGFEINLTSDEAYAYLHGWLTGLYYKWLVEEKIARIERIQET